MARTTAGDDELSARLDEPRLRRLIDVGRSFVEELDPEALLSGVLAAAQELTGARYAALGVLDEDRARLSRFLTRGVDAETQARIGELPHGRGILGVLIHDPEPLRLRTLQEHPRSFGFPPGHPPMSTFLGVPIMVRGAAWGNLYLTEKQGGPFDAADQEALMILADWAAVAVENARLYTELQRRHADATRANEILAATNAISRAIGAETDLERVLELVVERGRVLIHARTMLITLAEEEELVIAALSGDAGTAHVGTRMPIAGTTAGEVLSSKRARRLPVTEMGRPPAQLGIQATRGGLVVPLVFRGRSLGAITALDPLGGEAGFSVKNEELLSAFAATVATAVVTARQVGESRMREALESAEQERRRWARELHDETLQGLAALQVRLSVTERRSADAGTASAVREVLDDLGAEIHKLRALITELRPAALDELGLEPALRSLAAAASESGSLDVDLLVELDRPRLSPELETTVYRVVQEALRNVVKHAGADRCAVEVTTDASAVGVVVRDNGQGVTDDVLARRTGFGVTGMRERARLTGGTLTLRPGAHGGAELRARLPLGG